MHATTVHHGHIHHGWNRIQPLKWLYNAMATRHQRIQLDQLDDHLLRDIGIDRPTARKESERPFWDMQ